MNFCERATILRRSDTLILLTNTLRVDVAAGGGNKNGFGVEWRKKVQIVRDQRGVDKE